MRCQRFPPAARLSFLLSPELLSKHITFFCVSAATVSLHQLSRVWRCLLWCPYPERRAYRPLWVCVCVSSPWVWVYSLADWAMASTIRPQGLLTRHHTQTLYCATKHTHTHILRKAVTVLLPFYNLSLIHWTHMTKMMTFIHFSSFIVYFIIKNDYAINIWFIFKIVALICD